MTKSSTNNKGQPGEPPREPPPAAREDLKALKWFLLWLSFCALVGILFLIFAIWVDWA